MRYPADVRAHQLQFRADGVVNNVPTGRRQHGTDDGEQRALAGAVRPLQERDAPSVESGADRPERRRGTEQPRDIADLDTLNHAACPANQAPADAARAPRVTGSPRAGAGAGREPTAKAELSSKLATLNPQKYGHFGLTQFGSVTC